MSTSIGLDTTLAHLSTLFGIPRDPCSVVPTRQNSSSGRPKSPRIQVVLPEDLCQRLAALAESESRTVSNMAKVLIQQGVERFELRASSAPEATTDRFRAALEQQRPQRLRGAPRRLRLQRPT